MRRQAAQLAEVLTGRDLDLIQLVAREAHSLGLKLYLVGGFPRDLTLGRSPTDYDLVVEGNSIELARKLAAKHGGKVTVHPRFGTAKWHFEAAGACHNGSGAGSSQGGQFRGHVDLISARSESYPRPAQLPHVRLGTIEEDLRRRDFTINTLAIRLDGRHFGTILDPLGALDDIERGAIRALHEASFRDDPTRMYRAVRYEQRLGFRIVPETLLLIPGSRQWIGQLSAHRIREELDQILGEDHAASMVHRLGRLDLLRAIHPALPCDRGVITRLKTAERSPDGSRGSGGRGRRWLLWLGGLSPAQVRSVNRRLLFDNRLTAELLAVSALRKQIQRIGGLRPSLVTEYLGNLPLSAVEAVCDTLPPGRPRHVLQQYLTDWRHVRARVTGTDLKELGVPPGPVYRSILRSLRAGWIDGTIRSTAEERDQLEKSVAKLRGPDARRKRIASRHRPH